MATVFLALGSNVGDSSRLIADAVKRLDKSITAIKKAPVYVSAAVGITDQPDFYNTAIRGQTNLGPVELLRFVKTVEQDMGRIERFRWGPREIDIDIIFYDDQIMETAELTIPHPRFSEREFVLQPIADIDADLVDPTTQLSIGELLAQLPDIDHSILKKL